MDLLLVFLGLL